MSINKFQELKKNKPEISIVTAYFNRKEIFYETLKSIGRSEFKNFELIVVDDCSNTEHRLEEYLEEFPFMKIIRLEKENKWYVNPCIPFNIGIRAAVGDIIILQNPECLHAHDILSYVKKNIDDTKYISMATYALDDARTKLLNNFNNNDTVSKFIDSLPQISFVNNPVLGWYNHPKYRPVYYHFCSAITKANMKKLNGFDERFANGIAYDDDDFIVRIKRLKLNIIIPDGIFVVHQYHPTVFYNQLNVQELHRRNGSLFNDIIMKETKIMANEKI